MPRLIEPPIKRETAPNVAPYAALWSQQIWMPPYWRMKEFWIPKGETDTLNGVCKHAVTPMLMQAWMLANLKYSFDIFDTWQDAQTTFDRGRGDCEDWAILGAHCLRHHYDHIYYLLMFRKDGDTQYGHATLLIDHGYGKMETIGTFGWKKHNSGSIPKALKKFGPYKNWNRYMLLDLDFNIIEEKWRWQNVN